MISPFLQLVAKDLSSKYGKDFSRTIIVFPNKRAGLFMNEYLMQLSGGLPVWAPRYMTINELFRSFAPDLAINDNIDTTLRIVSLFRELSGREVTVDWFYGWAERLLSDFDDIDKSMVDATLLLQNVSEWKAFDDTSFLTKEQVRELKKFFSEFDPQGKSELRDKFQQLWDVMLPMYLRLNNDLLSHGLAYEGALFRKVVERLEHGEVSMSEDVNQYIFVGFNVLDEVEERLFKHLKLEGKARFYWDYDVYYTGDNEIARFNEAGTFIRKNLFAFPNELPISEFDNLSGKKQIQMIAASTEAIQAQFVAPWINEYKTNDLKRTAIVLCNEGNLLPVLHSLPDSVDVLNVTKGFPLSHTEVATFVEHQMNEWERQKCELPVTELLANLSELVNQQGVEFVRREDYDNQKFEDVLQGEAYFQMYTVLNRFAHILAKFNDAEVKTMTIVTLRRLLRGVVRQASIPFHGEPIEGLQIMGMLETRCLDFDRVLMLSVNEGVIPKRANDNSFIPYVLRKAYRLTTPERRTAVYAYNFYRLLQRAECVTMTYNTSSDGMSTGEMSRFMTQILIEWPGHVEHYSLNSRQKTLLGTPEAIAKPADLVERLTGDGKYPAVTPSALHNYLDCQLLFYFKNVLRIKEPELQTDQMQANTFGSIFHAAAELIYAEILERGGNVEPDSLLALVKNTRALQEYVRRAFEIEDVPYKVLEARVVLLYLETLLRRDAENGHFTIVGTEKKSFCLFEAEREGKPVVFRIHGIADRIDFVHTESGPTLRVLDYKTGSALTNTKGEIVATIATDVSELFDAKSKKGYMLQTFLYDKMLRQEATHDKRLAAFMQHPVTPALFFIRRASKKGYDPRLKIADEYVTDLGRYSEDFDIHLRSLLNEILDPSLLFQPTEDVKNCANCRYRGICHKVLKTDD